MSSREYSRPLPCGSRARTSRRWDAASSALRRPGSTMWNRCDMRVPTREPSSSAGMPSLCVRGMWQSLHSVSGMAVPIGATPHRPPVPSSPPRPPVTISRCGMAAHGVCGRTRVLDAVDGLVLERLVEHLELPVVAVAAADFLAVAPAAHAVVAAVLAHADVPGVAYLAGDPGVRRSDFARASGTSPRCACRSEPSHRCGTGTRGRSDTVALVRQRRVGLDRLVDGVGMPVISAVSGRRLVDEPLVVVAVPQREVRAVGQEPRLGGCLAVRRSA